MSQTLGKIEKPEAAPFKPERKVYLVTLLLSPPGAPEPYARLIERYWTAVGSQLARLEERIGQTVHIYMEMSDRPGEEGLKRAEEISPGAARLARGRVERGANFESLEDPETLMEALDWERCLYVGLKSRKVAQYVMEAAREASERRYRAIARRVEETLKEGEAGVAILTEQHRVAFPQGVHLFRVAPPELDEIHHWLRDYREQPPAGTKSEQPAPGESGAEDADVAQGNPD